ncbi:hypothetical protein ACIBJF_15800 [Streptomyces sp. NPDC050743]|uniref:hypothetical protein n=1 Tax=Streptomyces sp. NPDC050743 TaxID=3365634 RepID=UPI0037983491
MQHHDPVPLLHHPPLGLRDEPAGCRVALDDFDVDAHLLPVVDDGGLESLVHQGLVNRVGVGGYPGGRVQALGVEHHQARVGLAPPPLADLPTQQVVDGLVGAIVAPLVEELVSVDAQVDRYCGTLV